MNSKPAYYKEIIHSHKRRAPWHDYHSRCIYMVTITKNDGVPDFGKLAKGGNPEVDYVHLSRIGEIIKGEIVATPSHNPEIRILDYVVMPDHAHILVFVTQRIEKVLGDIVQAMKSSASGKIRKFLGIPSLTVFEENFNDRIVIRRGQLDTLYKYIRDNPRRLAVRREHPEYFRRVNALVIGGHTYQAYGNFQLLENPFKEQVVVHRADTPETQQYNHDFWLYNAANGGVLVSPFISQAERAVRSEAEKVGGRFILIINEPMGERYKPVGHDFTLCENGRLLIISANFPGSLTRQACMAMNDLAAYICCQQ